MTAQVIDGMTNTEYHAHPALGSTSLKTLATKTPAHYKHDQANPKHSPAFDLGTAIHSLTLEDDETGIVTVEAATWTGKAAQEARDQAYADGKTPLLKKDVEVAKRVRDAVHAHSVAGPLLTGHIAERSIFWEEDGLQLKCRPDALSLGRIVDLKSTRDANPNEFPKIAYDYGYFQSAALYIDGVEKATGERLPFLFILAEKTAPYLVSVVELDPEAIEYGRQMNDRAKRIYRDCVAADNWPGYPTSEPVSLPLYATYKLDDLLGLNKEVEIVFK